MNGSRPYAVLFTCAAWLAIGTASTRAQQVPPKIASIFVFNFARYVQWPVEASNGDLVIGVLGLATVTADLRPAAATVKVRNRNVVIKNMTALTAADVNGCHILFVSAKANKLFKDAARLVGSQPILLISETAGQPGSMINLFLDENEDRTKFELNRALLERNGLRASTSLLALAITI